MLNNKKKLNLTTLLIISGCCLWLLLLVITWSIPLVSGDLFTALAAGRDITAGKLTTPDSWSFSTGDRVWMNQNWGAGLLIYLVKNLGGETGLLALKFVLLAASSCFLFLALRRRRIPLVLALTMAAALPLSLNVYTLLRPNLFTVMFLCLELWLLTLCGERPHRIWSLVVLLGFWAHIHGGFIFGLGVLLLWELCILIPLAGTDFKGLKVYLKYFPSGFVIVLLLIGFTSPFGWRNLLFPLKMAGGGLWHQVLDWLPAWDFKQLGFFKSGILPFFLVTGLSLFLVVFRLVRGGRQKSLSAAAEKKPAGHEEIERRTYVFDLILGSIVVVMAFMANRFVAVALPVLILVLARELTWLGKLLRLPRLLPVVIQLVLLLAGAAVLRDNLRSYDSDNPLRNTGGGSLFEQMHYVRSHFNPELAEFIETNRVEGNILAPWSKEGYLRWFTPGLKVYIGGRAQQIYDEETFKRYLFLNGTPFPGWEQQEPVQVLNSLGAQWILTGESEAAYDLVITALRAGNWAIVYAGEGDILLANLKEARGAELAGKLAAGQLSYAAEVTAARSRAAFYFSQPGLWENVDLFELFLDAWDLDPAWLWSYKMLYTNLQYDAAVFGQVIRLLEYQQDYLESLDGQGAAEAERLECLIYLGKELGDITRRLHQEEEASRNFASLDWARQAYAELEKRWHPFVIDG